MSTIQSSRSSSHTSRGHRWLRAVAAAASFVLMTGGIILGPSFAVAPSQAAVTGYMPVSHEGRDPNWTTIPGWKAVWPGDRLLDEESLYWVANRSSDFTGTLTVLWAQYDWSADMSTYHTRAALNVQKTLEDGNGGTALTGSQFSTAAMSRIGGTMTDPEAPLTVYFWNYQVQSTMGGLSCYDGSTPIVRVTSGQTNLEWSCLPTPYGGRYSAGGEADQFTGNIYMIPGGGSIDNQSVTSTDASTESSWVFMVWDPISGKYSLSNSVQPGDWSPGMTTVPQERVKVLTDVYGSTNYAAGAAYDISLDADGNAYAYAGADPGSGGDGNMSIVRMEPARDSNGNIVDGTDANPWRYYVVTKITRSDTNQSWSAPSSIYGNGILNGQLIMGANTRVNINGTDPRPAAGTEYNKRGTTTVVRIDPQSATAQAVWSVANQDPIDADAYDDASSQGAEVIRGAVYQDLNGNGQITDDEPGLPGETVALYDASGKLLSIQQTDSLGQYTFLVAAMAGQNTIFYIRPVEVTTLLPDGQTRVNGIQSWGAGSVLTAVSVGNTQLTNTVEIQCTSGGITSIDGGPCEGARRATSADPPLGALGSVSSPSDWLTYAKVTYNTGQRVSTAEFGFKAGGSFGDAPAGPLTANVPMHVNSYPSVWLGETLGSYSGPASDTGAHPSDDGVYLNSYAGRLTLEGTVLATTYRYTLGADVSAVPESDADLAKLSGWVTQPGTNTWNPGAVWTPTVHDGAAAADFQISSGAPGAGVQLRVNASEATISLPTNNNREYYGADMWSTAGEIEDYGFTLADAVYRPAAVTTRGEGTFTVAGQEITAGTTVSVGSAVGMTAGGTQELTVAAPDTSWRVVGVTVRDTATGEIIDTPEITPGQDVTFPYTPVQGSDVVIEARFGSNIDPGTSVLSVDTDTAAAGESITATATIVNYSGEPVSGMVVTFSNASYPNTVVTGEDGTLTCTTGDDGKCSVTITSTVAGVYEDELSAETDGMEISGSPKTLTFTPAEAFEPTFEIDPEVDPGSESQADWRDADGADPYVGTLTLIDVYGNAITGRTSDIVFSSSSDTVTVSPITDNGDGTYTVSFTSKVASSEPTVRALYQGAQIGEDKPVPFKAGGFDADRSTFTVTPGVDPSDVSHTDWKLADGVQSYTGVLTAMDEHGNLLAGLLDSGLIAFTVSSPDVTMSDPVDNGDGTYSVTYTSVVASSQTTAEVAYDQTRVSDPQPIPFMTGALSAELSTFTVTPEVNPADVNQTGWIPADGQQHYTAVLTALDDQGNPISNLSLDDIEFLVSSDEVQISSVENTGNGTYAVTCTSLVGSSAPMASVTYQGTQIGADRPVPFAYGALDPAQSSFQVTPDADPADPDQVNWRASDGVDSYTGVLTARDAQGTLLADLTLSDLTFAASSPDVTISSATYTGNGTYTVKFTSHVGDSAPMASVVYERSQVGPAQPIPFAHGDFSAQMSTFQVTPGVDPADPDQDGWRVPDGESAYTGVLTARDADGNLLAGLTLSEINFAASSPDVTVSGVTYTGNGTYAVTYTSIVGSAAPTASVAYAGEPVGTDEPIPFSSGHFSSVNSTFRVGPSVDPADSGQTNWRIPDGESAYQAILTARDDDGHLLADLSLNDLDFSSSSPDVGISEVAYMGGGMYAVTYTSLVGSSRPTASVAYQDAQVGDDRPVPFSYGDLDTDLSSFQVGPAVDPSDPDQTGWRTPDGDQYYTGTLTAKDAEGHLLADLPLEDILFETSDPDVNISEVTYTGNGTYTVRFTSLVGSPAPTASVKVDGTQIGTDEPVPFSTQPGPGLYTLTLDRTIAQVGTPITATATIVDPSGDPVAGVTVSFTNASDPVTTLTGENGTKTCVTGEDGTCSVTITSDTPGVYTGEISATAVIDGEDTVLTGSEATVTFTEGPTAAQVSAEVGPDSQTVGEPVTITVRVTGTDDAPLSGLTEDDFAILVQGEGLDDLVLTDFQETEPGVYTWSTTSTQTGEYEVSVEVQGVEPEDNPHVTFIAGEVCVEDCTPRNPGDVTRVEVTTDQQPADGVSRDVVTVYAYDKYGNPVPDAIVSSALLDETDQVTIGSPIPPTGADGTTTIGYTSTRTGTHQVSVVVGGKTPDPSEVTLTFTQPETNPPDLIRSSWVIAPTGPLTVGVGPDNTYTATATILDRDGNPVPGVTVTFAVNSAAPVFAPVPTCVTGEDGICDVGLYSIRAGSYAVTATVTTGALTNSTTGSASAPVIWTTGPVCVESAGCQPDASVPVNQRTHTEVTGNDALPNEDVTITIHAFDEYGNAVPDAVFTLVTDDTDLYMDGTSYVPSVTVTTDPDGIATVKATSPKSGSHGVRVLRGTNELPDSPLDLRFLGTPEITGPNDGDTVHENAVEITGTGHTDGDHIVVIEGVTIVCEAEVVDGQWSCDADLADGEHTLIAVERTPDGRATSSDPVTVTVDTSLGTPQITSPTDGDTVHENAVEITGTGHTDGDHIVVTDGTDVVCEAEVVDGQWSCDADLADGEHTLIAVEHTPDGRSTSSDPVTVTVDTSLGTPQITSPADGDTVNENAVEITGTGHTDGDHIVVTDGDDVVCEAEVVDGQWSCDADLADGEHTLIAVERTPDGRTSSSDPVTVTVDTSLGTPEITSPADDDTLNDNAIEITGTGHTDGDRIVVIEGVNIVCEAVVADGQWSCDGNLPDGEHTLIAIEHTPEGRSSSSTPVTITVDTSLGTPQITSPVDGDTVNENAIEITGTGHTDGDRIIVIEGVNIVCETVVANGRWSCDANLPDGEHTLIAVERTSDNRASSSVPVTITVDTSIGSPDITSLTGGATVNQNHVKISGTGHTDGDTIIVTEGGKQICEAVVVNGKWSCEADLADGEHTVIATERTADGRETSSPPVTITVDTSLGSPDITSLTDGATVNDNHVVISGTGHTDGDTIIVTEGGKQICEAVVVNGKWSCEADLADGEHTVTAVERTADGRQTTSPSVTIIVDTGTQPTPTVSPSQKPTTTATQTATVSPSVTPTVSPSGSPTPTPSQTSTPPATQTTTLPPSETPTVSPSQTATVSPTQSPTGSPTVGPVILPNEPTSPAPTVSPSQSPTALPTTAPVSTPTASPTTTPTEIGTSGPKPPSVSAPTGGTTLGSGTALAPVLIIGFIVVALGLWAGVKRTQRKPR